jgi:hypothetical protein
LKYQKNIIPNNIKESGHIVIKMPVLETKAAIMAQK